MSIEKSAPYEKMVGRISEEAVQKFTEADKRELQTQESWRARFGHLERKKAPEEERLIALAQEEVRTVVERYNGRPRSIPAAALHIIPDENWFEANPMLADDKEISLARSGRTFINIRDLSLQRFHLADVIIHELFHFQGYRAFQFDAILTKDGECKKMLSSYRSGVAVTERHGRTNEDAQKFFEWLDEGIVQELTNRILEKFIVHPPRTMPEDFIPRDVTAESLRKEALFDQNAVVWGARAGERQAMWRMIRALYERNKNAFSDEDEIFGMLARAHFSGYLPSIARLIERTFGKGSFRTMGLLDE